MAVTKISARSNPAVTAAAALKEKKYREKSSEFIIEGRKLFEEAAKFRPENIEKIFCTKENTDFCKGLASEEKIFEVTREVMEKMSTEKAPQGIICVLRYIDKIRILYKMIDISEFYADEKRIFILSSLRDPGNLGTVLRTADALGFDAVMLSSDCADLYNPRAIRASMGAIFRLPVVICDDLPSAISDMRANGYEVYAAMLDREAKRLSDIKISRKTVFVVGNEGHGISHDVASACDGSVFIPISEGSESLNASVAASIFMWQSVKE